MLSEEERRVWMGGNALLDVDILPKDDVLNAWAKDGRDCVTWVATVLLWLADIGAREREEGCTKRKEDRAHRTASVTVKGVGRRRGASWKKRMLVATRQERVLAGDGVN